MNPPTKDNLIYLTVALLIVAVFVFYMFYTERTAGRIQEIPGPILWGIISTPGIVALLFNQFWTYRSRRLLWAITILTAALNVISVTVAYSAGWNPRVGVWAAMTLVWIYAAFFAGGKLLPRSSR